MNEDLIAPCGMNCRLCWGYIREKNTCPGCLKIRIQESQKSKYRSTCKIKNCEHHMESKTRYCSQDCDKYPCVRLRQLDKRYRAKYGMSMIGNLQRIHEFGIKYFVESESDKWKCPGCGGILCVHKPACLSCGYSWN